MNICVCHCSTKFSIRETAPGLGGFVRVTALYQRFQKNRPHIVRALLCHIADKNKRYKPRLKLRLHRNGKPL